MLFDSHQRRSEWAPQGSKFVALAGHAIVGMADPDVPWLMNVGSEFSKVFVTDEVRWLKQYLTKVQQAGTKETKVVPAGATIRISAPVKPSEKFAQALKDCLERNQEIKRAFLGTLQYEDEGKPPHLAFVLEAESATQQHVVNAISENLRIAFRSFLPASLVYQVILNDGSPIAAAIVNAGQPFYSKLEKMQPSGSA